MYIETSLFWAITIILTITLVFAFYNINQLKIYIKKQEDKQEHQTKALNGKISSIRKWLEYYHPESVDSDDEEKARDKALARNSYKKQILSWCESKNITDKKEIEKFLKDNLIKWEKEYDETH